MMDTKEYISLHVRCNLQLAHHVARIGLQLHQHFVNGNQIHQYASNYHQQKFIVLHMIPILDICKLHQLENSTRQIVRISFPLVGKTIQLLKVMLCVLSEQKINVFAKRQITLLGSIRMFCLDIFHIQIECEKYSKIFYGILSVPQNTVADPINVMHGVCEPLRVVQHMSSNGGQLHSVCLIKSLVHSQNIFETLKSSNFFSIWVALQLCQLLLQVECIY